MPGTGSIVFYAFPQEVVDQIAERTGGRPVTVEDSESVRRRSGNRPEGSDLPGQPFTQAATVSCRNA